VKRVAVTLLTLLFVSCMTQPPRRGRSDARAEEDPTGGASGGDETGGSSGSHTGGSGTGGKGTGGAGGKPDASVAKDSGEGTGGSRADGGAAPKLDASRDFGPVDPSASWDALQLVLANCVYCHNDPNKRLNLQYLDLYSRLVNAVAEKSPAGCPNRVVVVPGDPMSSLLYLKISGKMPAGCGVRMPFNKPPVTQMELDTVFKWIKAGAPM
jgi:hypothetical protein